MKKSIVRLVCTLIVMVHLFSVTPSAFAYEIGQPYQIDLSDRIDDVESRLYVQMMIDYYLRNDTQVQSALRDGFSAVFMFEGCSDNMNNPELSELSYYRVSAVCVVLKLDSDGNPYITYFNDACSSIPDRPLEYGAWWLNYIGNVGPATICDDTYQLYSTYHLGQYEALNVRDGRTDYNVAAVYMTPSGYEIDTANGINVHTRSSNHISSGGMWSEGCQLVGDGIFSDFTKFISATYYTAYGVFSVEEYVGTFTLNRYQLRNELFSLYGNTDAVDSLLAESLKVLPDEYLTGCNGMCYNKNRVMCTTGYTSLMSLPCSNATDARSLSLTSVSKGYELEVVGQVYNTAGNLWYEVNLDGKRCYVFSGNVEEKTADTNWYTRFFG